MDVKNTKYQAKGRKTEEPDLIIHGQRVPQAIELEMAVLGACMLEQDGYDRATELLKPETFYKTAHQEIFLAMSLVKGKGMNIEILSVVEQLKSLGSLDQCGGAYYVTTLTNSVVSGAAIEGHSRLIAEKWAKRELAKIGRQLSQSAYDETMDVFELMEMHDKAYTRVSMLNNGNAIRRVDSVMVDQVQRIAAAMERKQELSGVPSGFPLLDRITYGWQNSDLVILAARPAVGKTAFALNLARNAAMSVIKETPVLFFSLEMSAGQLVNRIMAAESEVWLENISRGKMEEAQMTQLYTKAIQPLSGAPIFIDDSPALNIYELRAKCRRMKAKHEIGMIIIDYLQLMDGVAEKRYGSREQEISNISRSLKQLAKELNVPVIALSQLSRAVEQRGSKGDSHVPRLSDLRESGAIEQDADMVMFLYRPEYHDIGTDPMGESTKGLTELKIAKHRNGVLDTVRLRAELHIQKFYPWDDGFASNQFPANRGGNWRPIGDSAETGLPFT